ncbi:hypothetical protein TanjilG_22405 [Lupinus angustifolius]|uniref:Uncharacterized protein n=1 Tax=Lupinus angustifolius TaxID=3871 RepID=A0A4P1RRT4_LUPAN|nr:hypothetical protein TanjilG_22405 [Lupinus angustifolius]
MAEEDESRAQTSTTLYEPDPESGYTPKDEEKANNNNSSNWLQLSVGSCYQSHSAAMTTTKHHQISKGDHHQMAPIIGSGLIELDLLPDNRSHNYNWSSSPTMFSGRSCQGGSSFGSASLLLEQTSMSMGMPSGPFSAQAFGNIQQQNHSMPIMPSSSFVTTSSSSYSLQSSSSFRPLGSYFATPFPHFPSSSSSSGFHQLDLVAGPTSDVTTVRVVDPPRRPHSGIWFMLQASQNQDGKMTVRLILKYLVSKLRLENESEIEITCRGQQLVPFLTLQHVRDNIWTQRNDTKTLLSDSSSSTSDHVMVLHYCRTIS